MAEDGFRRARRPEQKAQRREAILAAAAALLEEGGMEAATLSAIAARAGLVKSNLYRYFESREDILMALWGEDLAAAVLEIADALEAAPRPVSPETVARAMAAAYAGRPRLCLLTSRVADVLETNLSAARIAAAKAMTRDCLAHAVAALRRVMPALPEEAGIRAGLHLHLLVAGLWPAVNHGPVVAEVLARPEFRVFRLDFRRTLEAAVGAHLRGLLAETDQGPAGADEGPA